MCFELQAFRVAVVFRGLGFTVQGAFDLELSLGALFNITAGTELR